MTVFVLSCIIYFYLDVVSTFRTNIDGTVIDTDAVHPANVGRDTGEDGRLLVGVAARGGHKAGHTMNNPLAVDTAVQGATRVTLQGFREKQKTKKHHRVKLRAANI